MKIELLGRLDEIDAALTVLDSDASVQPRELNLHLRRIMDRLQGLDDGAKVWLNQRLSKLLKGVNARLVVLLGGEELREDGGAELREDGGKELRG